jgi:hypothetical protein
MCNVHPSQCVPMIRVWRTGGRFGIAISLVRFGKASRREGTAGQTAIITVLFMHKALFLSFVYARSTTCAERRLGRLIMVHRSVPIMRTPIALHGRPPEKVT